MNNYTQNLRKFFVIKNRNDTCISIIRNIKMAGFYIG